MSWDAGEEFTMPVVSEELLEKINSAPKPVGRVYPKPDEDAGCVWCGALAYVIDGRVTTVHGDDCQGKRTRD